MRGDKKKSDGPTKEQKESIMDLLKGIESLMKGVEVLKGAEEREKKDNSEDAEEGLRKLAKVYPYGEIESILVSGSYEGGINGFATLVGDGATVSDTLRKNIKHSPEFRIAVTMAVLEEMAEDEWINKRTLAELLLELAKFKANNM